MPALLFMQIPNECSTETELAELFDAVDIVVLGFQGTQGVQMAQLSDNTILFI